MEAKNWKTEKETIIRCVLLNLAGVFIYAVGINSFAAPHKIAPGGASGIAILINYLTGCPIGLFVFVFNIPLLLIIVVKNIFRVLSCFAPCVYRSALHCDRSGDRQDSGIQGKSSSGGYVLRSHDGDRSGAGAYGTVQHRGILFWD